MAADSGSGSEMDYTDSEEERKREEQRAIEEKKRVDKCIFFFQKKHRNTSQSGSVVRVQAWAV